MKLRALLLILVPVFAIGAVAVAWPGTDREKSEEQIEFDAMPAAVQAAVERLASKSAVTEIDRVTKQGIVVYDVEYKKEGRTNSMTLAESGVVLMSEDEIDVSNLPAVVRERIADQFGAVDFVKAEAVTLYYFKVAIAKEGRKREIQALASGHLDDDDEDGDGDDDDEDEDDDDEEEDEDEDD